MQIEIYLNMTFPDQQGASASSSASPPAQQSEAHSTHLPKTSIFSSDPAQFLEDLIEFARQNAETYGFDLADPNNRSRFFTNATKIHFPLPSTFYAGLKKLPIPAHAVAVFPDRPETDHVLVDPSSEYIPHLNENDLSFLDPTGAWQTHFESAIRSIKDFFSAQSNKYEGKTRLGELVADCGVDPANKASYEKAMLHSYINSFAQVFVLDLAHDGKTQHYFKNLVEALLRSYKLRDALDAVFVTPKADRTEKEIKSGLVKILDEQPKLFPVTIDAFSISPTALGAPPSISLKDKTPLSVLDPNNVWQSWWTPREKILKADLFRINPVTGKMNIDSYIERCFEKNENENSADFYARYRKIFLSAYLNAYLTAFIAKHEDLSSNSHKYLELVTKKLVEYSIRTQFEPKHVTVADARKNTAEIFFKGDGLAQQSRYFDGITIDNFWLFVPLSPNQLTLRLPIPKGEPAYEQLRKTVRNHPDTRAVPDEDVSQKPIDRDGVITEWCEAYIIPAILKVISRSGQENPNEYGLDKIFELIRARYGYQDINSDNTPLLIETYASLVFQAIAEYLIKKSSAKLSLKGNAKKDFEGYYGSLFSEIFQKYSQLIIPAIIKNEKDYIAALMPKAAASPAREEEGVGNTENIEIADSELQGSDQTVEFSPDEIAGESSSTHQALISPTTSALVASLNGIFAEAGSYRDKLNRITDGSVHKFIPSGIETLASLQGISFAYIIPQITNFTGPFYGNDFSLENALQILDPKRIFQDWINNDVLPGFISFLFKPIEEDDDSTLGIHILYEEAFKKQYFSLEHAASEYLNVVLLRLPKFLAQNVRLPEGISVDDVEYYFATIINKLSPNIIAKINEKVNEYENQIEKKIETQKSRLEKFKPTPELMKELNYHWERKRLAPEIKELVIIQTYSKRFRNFSDPLISEHVSLLMASTNENQMLIYLMGALNTLYTRHGIELRSKGTMKLTQFITDYLGDVTIDNWQEKLTSLCNRLYDVQKSEKFLIQEFIDEIFYRDPECPLYLFYHKYQDVLVNRLLSLLNHYFQETYPNENFFDITKEVSILLRQSLDTARTADIDRFERAVPDLILEQHSKSPVVHHIKNAILNFRYLSPAELVELSALKEESVAPTRAIEETAIATVKQLHSERFFSISISKVIALPESEVPTSQTIVADLLRLRRLMDEAAQDIDATVLGNAQHRESDNSDISSSKQTSLRSKLEMVVTNYSFWRFIQIDKESMPNASGAVSSRVAASAASSSDDGYIFSARTDADDPHLIRDFDILDPNNEFRTWMNDRVIPAFLNYLLSPLNPKSGDLGIHQIYDIVKKYDVSLEYVAAKYFEVVMMSFINYSITQAVSQGVASDDALPYFSQLISRLRLFYAPRLKEEIQKFERSIESQRAFFQALNPTFSSDDRFTQFWDNKRLLPASYELEILEHPNTSLPEDILDILRTLIGNEEDSAAILDILYNKFYEETDGEFLIDLLADKLLKSSANFSHKYEFYSSVQVRLRQLLIRNLFKDLRLDAP